MSDLLYVFDCSFFLLSKGALSVRAYITHGVLTGKSCKRIQDSKLEEVVITDSISYHCDEGIEKIRQVSVDKLIGEAIRRVSNEESVSTLFS